MLYPNNIKKTTGVKIPHSKRGMGLESDINLSNSYYLENDIALIYKKPTPIDPVKVCYEKNKKIINKAYFKTQSTLDYNGIYKGRYVDFEAKETTCKTSFPLGNIHKHQIKHIRDVNRHGGIAFIILRMNGFVYLLTGEDFINYIDNNDRKSITFDYINKKGVKIKEGINPRLNYLEILDKIYFKEDC